MRILAEDTLCIIIDDQQKLIPTIFQHKELISNTKKLISGLLSLNIPVLITEHYKKGLGETVSDLKEILSTSEQAKFFEKITFSAYDTAEIKEYINALNKKNVIICGTEAHICVLQTAIDIQNNGYQVILVADCVGSRTEENKKIALKRAELEGAMITTYESILFELLRKAGTPEFKTILNIIK